MNMDRLIRMGLRMLMNKGINKGIDIAARRGKAPDQMTAEDQAQANQAKGTAQKARRGLSVMRRFMR